MTQRGSFAKNGATPGRRSTQSDFAALVNAVKMEDIFREIEANSDDVHGRLLFCG